MKVFLNTGNYKNHYPVNQHGKAYGCWCLINNPFLQAPEITFSLSATPCCRHQSLHILSFWKCWQQAPFFRKEEEQAEKLWPHHLARYVVARWLSMNHSHSPSTGHPHKGTGPTSVPDPAAGYCPGLDWGSLSLSLGFSHGK